MKKRHILLAVLGLCALAGAMIGGGCSGGENVREEHSEHSWTAWETVTAPDCENDGLESRHCTGCDERETRPLRALGHTFGELTEKIEPSCETAGTVAYYECSVCGKKFDETKETELGDDELEIKAPGHDYGQLVPRVAPSCEAGGMEAHYVCGACGQYFDAKQRPTDEEHLKIPATEHSFTALHPEVSAGCETAGTVAYYECGVCGKKFNETKDRELGDDELEIKALGHDYGQKIAQREATCEEAGEKAHYHCGRCGKDFDEKKQNELSKEDLKIEPQGHAYGDLIPRVAPSCGKEGMEAHYRCGRCGKYFDEGQRPTTEKELTTGALEHAYGQKVAQQDATCEDAGKQAYYHCSRCGKYFDEEKQPTDEEDLIIPPKGHEYGQKVAQQDATCEDAGKQAYYHCSRCGKYFDEEQQPTDEEDLIIPPKGHDYGQPTAQREATCEDAGERAHYQCQNCGKYFEVTEEKRELSEQELVLSPLGHSFGEKTEKIEPSCETAGQAAYFECGRCKKKFNEDKTRELGKDELEIEALGHSYTLFHPEVPAECEKTGTVAHYECDRCHQKVDKDRENKLGEDELEIAAKGHDYTIFHPEVPAECETAGTVAYYECNRCHQKVDKEQKNKLGDGDLEIKANGHQFVTEYDAAQHYQKCQNCSEKRNFEPHDTAVEDYGCSKCEWHAEYTQSLQFREEDLGYTVTGTTNPVLTRIVIPDTYAGRPVLKIGRNAFGAENVAEPKPIVHVTFGAQIEEIGDYAFWNCAQLEDVSFPDGLRIIGVGAFSRCASLTGLQFGPALETLDQEAFWGCTSLRGAVVFPASVKTVGQWAFSSCSGIGSIRFSGSVTVVQSAFYGCVSLTSATFGDGDVTLGNWTFQECTGLRSIVFGNGDISLGESLLYNAFALEEISFGRGDKNIGSWVFYRNSLQEVDFGDGNVTLAQYAFDECGSLETVDLGDGNASLTNSSLYGCPALREVTFGNGDPQIAAAAFFDCDGIRTLSFGDGVHCFETNLFSSGVELETLRFGKGTTCLEEYTFPTFSLKELSIGGGNVTIGERAFSSSPIQTLTFGSGTYEIGERAFSCCKSLTDLKLPDGKLTLAEYAFEECGSLTSVLFGNGEKEIAPRVFHLSPVQSIGFGDGRMTVANNGFTWLSELTQVTFGKDPVVLGEQTFYGCEALEEAHFYGEAEVGDRAFLGCYALSSVCFENGNVRLAEYAFCGCRALKTVYIGDGESVIGNSCFDQCHGLDSFEKGAGSVDIGQYAFQETGIRSVTVHGACTVGLRAFQNCADLVSVALAGRVDELAFESFSNCTSLINFSIGDDIGNINSGAFNGTEGIGLCEYEGAEYLGNPDNRYAILMHGKDKSAPSVKIHPDTRVICGSAFADYTLLGSVTIPEHVTQIGSYAFKGCAALSEVTLGASVKKIGNSAFRDCTGLLAVTFEGGGKEISEFAFDNCTALTRVNVSDLPTWLSLRFEGTQRVGSTNPLYYGATLYVGGTPLTALVIPDGVRELSPLAFAGYKHLTSVQLGRDLEKIDSSAFYGCSELTAITGGNNYYMTAGNCILECSSKTVVLGCAGSTIPEEAESIGEYAFYAVKFKNPTLVFPESLASVGGHAFYASNLSDLTVGSGLKSVGTQAFGNVSWKQLHINDLKAWCLVDFADSGSVALDYCIIYVDGTQVTHNQNVLTVTGDVTEIKPYAFYHSQVTTLRISANTVSISERAFAGSPSLNHLTVEAENPVYEEKSYGLFDKVTKTLVHGVLEKNTTNAKIGEEVEHIAPYAFMNRLVKSLTLPSSLKDIGGYAFYSCRIEGSITIYAGVTSIGESAFAHNTNATSVSIPATVTYIGKDAFYQTGLTEARFGVTDGWTVKHFVFGTTEDPDLRDLAAAAEQLKKSGYIWTR